MWVMEQQDHHFIKENLERYKRNTHSADWTNHLADLCAIPLFHSHLLSTKIYQKKENRQTRRRKVQQGSKHHTRQCSSSCGTDQASGFCTSTCYFAKHEEQPSKTQNSNSFLFWNRITHLTLKTHRKHLKWACIYIKAHFSSEASFYLKADQAKPEPCKGRSSRHSFPAARQRFQSWGNVLPFSYQALISW